MTTKNFETLFTHYMLHNADSVEWCPIAPYEDHFTCGTYEYNEGAESSLNGRKRQGTISLFQLTSTELKEMSSVDAGGVLDMKWCPHRVDGANIALGVATADGEIRLYYMAERRLEQVTSCCLKKSPGDYLMLSLDWSKNAGSDILICASDTNGNVCLLKFLNGDLMVLSEWNAHSLEAWICCFDFFNSSIVYTGGDDAKLHAWDVRTDATSKMVTCKKHTSGVTVLASHHSFEHCLATGSYDETICVWDKRNWKDPIREIQAAGGLWRLKWHPRPESRHLLAASIYGGFEVVKPFEDRTRGGYYKEHDSLAYGADWCRIQPDAFPPAGKYIIATCSFYDKKLCVSLWNEDEIINDDGY